MIVYKSVNNYVYDSSKQTIQHILIALNSLFYLSEFDFLAETWLTSGMTIFLYSGGVIILLDNIKLFHIIKLYAFML